MLYRISGYKDHLHFLSDLHPNISLADYIKDIKISSSLWLKKNGNFPNFEGWAEGYACFTIAHKDRNRVIEYIKNQVEHHKSESFMDEYKRLLNEFGVKYDERYL
jgi:putative transposase